MNKALMISIRPQHAVNILIGKKTLELRTWIPKDYVGWVYVYVTKGKRLSVVYDDENGKTYYYLNSNWGRSLNQDIPFRFWFDEYSKVYFNMSHWRYEADANGIDIAPLACLTTQEIKSYSRNGGIYAWHIKKLEIFDEPKSLSDFYNVNIDELLLRVIIPQYIITKPPQRSVWVYVR